MTNIIKNIISNIKEDIKDFGVVQTIINSLALTVFGVAFGAWALWFITI